MKNLIIHGQLESKTDSNDFPTGLKNVLVPKHSAKIQRARAGHPPHELQNVDDHDLVQIELSSGIKLWIRAEDLAKDYGLKSSRGEVGEGIELPHTLAIGPASRGLVGNWVIKGLKVFGIDVAAETTDFIKEKVEGRLTPGPGLYRWEGKEPSDYKRIQSVQGKKPWLVFIHGTASSTDGSFGGLWEASSRARMAELRAHFQNQVLAFQHRTLTQSPIQNALELAQKLPKGAHLYLVSHSRGGLVGELLCRSMVEGGVPFDQKDFQLFPLLTRKSDREDLEKLGQLLQEKNFVIERFVRVGCPARGTTLASGRLDRYLSIIMNVLEAIPGFKANPVFEGISALLIAVVKKRKSPEDFPGLAAQMPDSPLIRILNRPGVRTDADLHVLGGDLAGEGFMGRLKTFVTDLFYREDHDLVVNTPAMLGGTERNEDIQYWIDTGKAVDHFHYFRNSDTTNRLFQALTKEDTRSGFHLLETKPYEVTEADYLKRAVTEPRPAVYVLPGVMGSHLKVGKDRVWLDILDLSTGGLKKLRHTAKNVQPDKPIGKGYKDLIRFLADSHDVRPFAYDWRKSLLETAHRLRQDLEKTLDTLEATQQPLRIIAHSMGGLVVRVMLATPEGNKVWERMCKHQGARFIMLGTPNGGSHAITAMLMGRDPLVRKLALLDFTNSQSTLLEIISKFDGVLQLLPHSGTLDVYQVETWKKLYAHDLDELKKRNAERGLFGQNVATSKTAGIMWTLPGEKQLSEALTVKKLIEKSPIDPQRMIYVAGCADATPCDISIDSSAVQSHRVRVDATTSGDGRVPWATGIPSELKNQTYYVETEHGDLANTHESFHGLLDLLNTGITTKLSKHPPVRRGVSAETFELRVAIPDMYPNEQDLIASALGSRQVTKQRQPAKKVSVRVIHGNLARASSPVAVGHYYGDTIVSAEAYLDRQLEGRLRERHRLGLYPDHLNTSSIFLNDGASHRKHVHPGAIVVGLGMVGSLPPGALASTMADAVVNYALECLELERERRRSITEPMALGDTLDISLTTLLIGTGGAGLSLADSLQSILRGILQANRRLKLKGGNENSEKKEERTAQSSFLTAYIDTVDVMELYQDRAIQATKALLELGHSKEFQDHLLINEFLVQGSDGRHRVSYDEDGGWWQRLRIATEKDGSLKFEALTNRARAETYLRPTQKKLIEKFLARPMASTQNDPELSRTLFELVIPNQMKEYAPDRRNLVLVLDEESAAYPWELLHDRFDPNSRPLSVEAGMIRQMTTPQFRESVLHGTRKYALVVGDPTSQEPQGKFSPLPGAAAEAREVGKLLRQQEFEDVVELVEEDATPEAVLTALHKQPYRIVHLAAHGVFEFPLEEDQEEIHTIKKDPCAKQKTVTGMVLGEGLFLTPAEIDQMRYVPELVFLNCCHLGQTKGSAEQPHVQFHRLASNLGTQLIQMGVRAVVAAGWAVDDKDAKIFARKFYEGMFRGLPFGEAVQLAREEIYSPVGGSNTWGAYQCYGDPDFSLTKRSSPSSNGDRIVSPAELQVELNNLAQWAKTSSPEEKDRLQLHLLGLTKGMAPGWSDSASMCAALGRAYGEVGLLEEAVRFYDRGRPLQPADATVESLEQLANLKVRWGLKRAEQKIEPQEQKSNSTENDVSIKDLFKDAENILDGLLKIQKTQERCALKGKIYKGRAILSTDSEQRRKALQEMRDWYDEGHKIGEKTERDDLYYPLENRLAAEIVLSWEPPRGRKTNKREKERRENTKRIDDGLAELRKYGEELKQHGKSFWDMSLLPGQQLLTALHKQSMNSKDQKEIIEGYLVAQRRGGSAREMDSVINNIKFFESMIQPPIPQNVREKLAEGLKQLREELEPKKGEDGESKS